MDCFIDLYLCYVCWLFCLVSVTACLLACLLLVLYVVLCFKVRLVLYNFVVLHIICLCLVLHCGRMCIINFGFGSYCLVFIVCGWA